MPLNYAGKTLRGRPFKPGEDLREANFSGANLRGVNFEGLDLSGANFSYADIRGANFTKAILKGANFSHAKAGLQRRWTILLVIFSLILSVVSGFSSFILGLFTAYFFLPETIKENTIIPGIVYLIRMPISLKQG
jgi:Pentapeptide repeats (8 copies)